MANYKKSELELTAPGRPEVIGKWRGDIMGGRVPSFAALAKRTGGVYWENPPSVADGKKGTDLDFEVRLESLQAVVAQDGMSESGELVKIEKRIEVPRFRAAVAHYNDGRDPQVLSTWQSPKYVPIQTDEALAWGDAMSGSQLVALGAWGDPVGSKVFAAYDLGGFRVGGQDDHELVLNITTTHDGTGATTARVVPLRLQCTNEGSFHFGRGSANPSIKVRHTVNAKDALAQAQATVSQAREYLGVYAKNMDGLLKVKMTENDFITWTRELYEVPKDEAPKGAAQQREDTLVELLHGDTTEFGRGTRYAALQAVTEYAQHLAPVRATDEALARATRVVRGRVDDLMDRAYASLV